jgi:hypothetical protein
MLRVCSWAAPSSSSSAISAASEGVSAPSRFSTHNTGREYVPLETPTKAVRRTAGCVLKTASQGIV